MHMQDLMQADVKYSSALRIDDSKSINRILCVFFAHSGDSWFWLAGLVIIWFVGNQRWHNTAAFLALGLTMLSVVVLLLKFSIRRPRPEGDWGQIYRATDPHSFPSGHSARAAAIAVMSILTGPAWFTTLMLVWAPLVGLARIRLGVHYISDVVVGMVIGIVMGLLANAIYPLLASSLPFLF